MCRWAVIYEALDKKADIIKIMGLYNISDADFSHKFSLI
jgi:hypothetical protein